MKVLIQVVQKEDIHHEEENTLHDHAMHSSLSTRMKIPRYRRMAVRNNQDKNFIQNKKMKIMSAKLFPCK